MVLFRPLRHDPRVFAARAGAAFAAFLTIAVVLLVGANAKADEATAEPVIGEPPSGAQVMGEGSEDPSAGDSQGQNAGDSQENAAFVPAGGNPSGGGKHEDKGQGHGSTGGDKGNGQGQGNGVGNGNGNGQGNGNGPGEGEASGGNSGEQPAPPSGGGKGSEPGSGSGSDDSGGEPAPSGRPQVTPPAEQQPGATPSEVVEAPVVQDPQPGSGEGQLRDQPASSGQNRQSTTSRNARLTSASTVGGGAGANPAGDGGTAAGGSTGTSSAPTGTSAPATTGGATGGTQSSGGENQGERPSSEKPNQGTDEPNIVTRTFTDFVEVVPDSLKAALAALAALSVLLGIGYLLTALRARRLARQRHELLQEVGLLQTALLPPVPDKVGALLTSVAYRPADGPGAGGDFYDVLPLPGGRVGFILGDVSGHGRGALARTAFMRYTLRAYLEAGLEPRVALQVAGRVIDENLGGDFATVLLAVHDPETGSLTYATAGHPAPIVVGPQPHEPVTAGSSPPIGVGVRTGLRQTTVPLVPGSVAALFTDGLLEARTADGILGRERLAALLDELGDQASARGLIERVANEANVLSDDMAAVVVTPTAGVTAGLFRTEQLELSARELDGPIARRFLEACGLPEDEVDDAERDARLLADRFGGVLMHVVFGNRLRVEVLPRNVESIEAASRRVSAASA